MGGTGHAAQEAPERRLNGAKQVLERLAVAALCAQDPQGLLSRSGHALLCMLRGTICAKSSERRKDSRAWGAKCARAREGLDWRRKKEREGKIAGWKPALQNGRRKERRRGRGPGFPAGERLRGKGERRLQNGAARTQRASRCRERGLGREERERTHGQKGTDRGYPRGRCEAVKRARRRKRGSASISFWAEGSARTR